jgi:hypothetical protein
VLLLVMFVAQVVRATQQPQLELVSLRCSVACHSYWSFGMVPDTKPCRGCLVVLCAAAAAAQLHTPYSLAALAHNHAWLRSAAHSPSTALLHHSNRQRSTTLVVASVTLRLRERSKNRLFPKETFLNAQLRLARCFPGKLKRTKRENRCMQLQGWLRIANCQSHLVHTHVQGNAERQSDDLVRPTDQLSRTPQPATPGNFGSHINQTITLIHY